jgi:hypothetical protein
VCVSHSLCKQDEREEIFQANIERHKIQGQDARAYVLPGEEENELIGDVLNLAESITFYFFHAGKIEK